MVAHVGDSGSVGRPNGVAFVVNAVVGELVELPGIYVVEIEESPICAAEISLDILFEVIAVDDDGLRLLFLLVFLVVLRVFVGVVIGADGQEKLLAVGRPRVRAKVPFDLRELSRFSAATVEHPHLCTLGFARPLGLEGQEFSVRAPARRA